MAGSFAYSRDADVAASARERLDRTVARAAAMEAARRDLLAELIGLWPSSAWLAAGAASVKAWLLAYTNLSEREALRMVQLAGLCAAHPDLAEAVVGGEVSLGRAERLSRCVTRERAPFLAGALDTFLDLNANTSDEDAFDQALRYWAARVDEQLPARRVQTHSLVLVPALFGGGQIHGQLAPVAFETVKTAIGAWTQDPDPKDAPYQRTLSERQADALDDLAHFALTHDPDHTHDPANDDAAAGDDDGIDWEDLAAGDTFDGSYPGDEFDEALAVLDDGEDAADCTGDNTADRLDPMVLLRRRLRRAEKHRRRRLRRRTRLRSGVTTNVHIDLRTLAGLRDIDDLDDLILRGDGWTATRAAAGSLQRCPLVPVPPPPHPHLRLATPGRRHRPLDRHRPPRHPLDRTTHHHRTDPDQPAGPKTHRPQRCLTRPTTRSGQRRARTGPIRASQAGAAAARHEHGPTPPPRLPVLR